MKAFTTTRNGGVSTGNYATFNANHYCGDNPDNVAANRQLLCKELGIDQQNLIIPHQTHGTNILTIDDTFLALPQEQRADRLENIDALITNKPRVAICVSTADCVPILIYDTKNHAAASIHAGWRGTVGRIAEHALTAMQTQYATNPTDCIAIIGPSISVDSFEVGTEVYEQFQAAGFNMAEIAQKQDKWHIDLWQCNRMQLTDKGILLHNIQTANICTYLHTDTFFSARRLGIKTGRMLTGIVLDMEKHCP